MKKIILSTSILIMMVFYGCTNLDVEIKSELTPDNFPTTEEQFASAMGVIYSDFVSATGYAEYFAFQLQVRCSDEAVAVSNGSNWYNGGESTQLFYHDFKDTNPYITGSWDWLFRTIGSCNKVNDLFKDVPASDAKDMSIAEIRVMRAFCYYLLMDNWGGVPIITQFGEELKGRDSRQAVYEFIEKEITESIPFLTEDINSKTWGRPNKWAAHAMLAKLYINAPIYIGSNKNTEAIAACDAVIAAAKAGKTGLTAKNEWLKMFDYDNGPKFTEFLFVAPLDDTKSKSFRAARYCLPVDIPNHWNLQFTVSANLRVNPEFYETFTEDAGDVRTKQFLAGKLYSQDGATPLRKKYKRSSFNSTDYGGFTPGSPQAIAYRDEEVEYHEEVTRDIIYRDLNTLDCGDDVEGRLSGYRTNKFNPSKTQPGREQSNDFPVLRYADVLLLKAEAILRGGAPTLGDSPLSLVNQVRSRAGATEWGSVDLDGIYFERGRELSFEGWKRNDMIRFGKYEDTWGPGYLQTGAKGNVGTEQHFKTNKDVQKRLFPIPLKAVQANPLLTPNNDGY